MNGTMKGEGCGPPSSSLAGPFPVPVCAPQMDFHSADLLAHCRSVWFHVPDTPSTVTSETPSEEQSEARARNIIEKRTAINLVEAFSVALKHYLRGEEGMYYQDLYHLVKFFPAYSLPAGMPSQRLKSRIPAEEMEATMGGGSWSGSTSTGLPTSNSDGRAPFHLPTVSEERTTGPKRPGFHRGSTIRRPGTHYRRATGPHGDVDLAPASNPPNWGAFDLWPLSLLVKIFTKKRKPIGGKKAAKERAKDMSISHNIPLGITLYMVCARNLQCFLCFNFVQSSYIASLQQRKVVEAPTISRSRVMSW